MEIPFPPPAAKEEICRSLCKNYGTVGEAFAYSFFSLKVCPKWGGVGSLRGFAASFGLGGKSFAIPE